MGIKREDNFCRWTAKCLHSILQAYLKVKSQTLDGFQPQRGTYQL